METTEVSSVSSSGKPMRATLAETDRAGKYPGVIVIHEIFGLNDDIRKITAKMASLGYVALAPDLYDGPGPRTLCIARTIATLRRGEGDAFADLEAARAFL